MVEEAWKKKGRQQGGSSVGGAGVLQPRLGTGLWASSTRVNVGGPPAFRHGWWLSKVLTPLIVSTPSSSPHSPQREWVPSAHIGQRAAQLGLSSVRSLLGSTCSSSRVLLQP